MPAAKSPKNGLRKDVVLSPATIAQHKLEQQHVAPRVTSSQEATLRQLRELNAETRRKYSVPRREEDPNFMAGVFDHEGAVHQLHSGKR